MSRHKMLRIFTFFIVCILHITTTLCIDIEISSTPVSCHGKSDGSLSVTIIDSERNYQLRLLQSSNNSIIGQVFLSRDTSLTFLNLKSQKYKVLIIDSGEITKRTLLIGTPEPLKAKPIEVIEYPTTDNSSDGKLKAITAGGTPPYSFKWSDNIGNQITQIAEGVRYGVYRCTINDKNNCGPVTATIFFKKRTTN